MATIRTIRLLIIPITMPHRLFLGALPTQIISALHHHLFRTVDPAISLRTALPMLFHRLNTTHIMVARLLRYLLPQQAVHRKRSKR